MIVFSWEDLKRLFITKWKKIVRFGLLCGVLTFFFVLCAPVKYEARATFKQSASRTDKSFDLKNFIQTISTGGPEGSVVAILLSDTVLEKVVQHLNLQTQEISLASTIAHLRKSITIKPAKEDKNLLLIKCCSTNREKSAAIVNTLMEMYEKYLIEENKIIIGAQLSYLKLRQDELSLKFEKDVQDHAFALKQNLLSKGVLGTKDEIEFILEPLRSHQKRLDKVELELRQIQNRLENVQLRTADKPHLARRYSEVLAQQIENARDQTASDLSSRYLSMQHGEKLIDSIENDLTGISLKSARELFDQYSLQFDSLHSELKQIVFMRDHLFDPEVEIGTLSNILSDPVSQQMVQKSTHLEAELNDDLSHSLKDRTRLETALSTHKRFLKSHLQQTLELGKIRSALLQEKLSSLYLIIQTHLLQEKQTIQENISRLKESMQTLPELWAYENRLKFKTELTKAMMEGLVNIAETKNLSHHLYQVESRPLDKAKVPTASIPQRFLLKSIFGSALSMILCTLFFTLRSLLKGMQTSLTTARELGVHTSGALSWSSPLTLPSLSENDCETLRRVASFLLENKEKAVVASIGDSQTNFFPALTALLQKHQKTSCVIDCSLGKIATKEESGLLQALHGEAPLFQNFPTYDFLPTGGSSSDSVEYLTSKPFQTLIQKLSQDYDYLFLVSRTPLDTLESEGLLRQSDLAIASLEKLSSDKEYKSVTFIQYPTRVEAW